jgi:hypothetical protein
VSAVDTCLAAPCKAFPLLDLLLSAILIVLSMLLLLLLVVVVVVVALHHCAMLQHCWRGSGDIESGSRSSPLLWVHILEKGNVVTEEKGQDGLAPVTPEK